MKKFIITIASILVLFFGFVSCSDDEAQTQNQDQVASRPDVPTQNGQVRIGTQVWMTKNLNVSRYSDGTPIPQVTNPAQWENLTTGAWCYYNNSTTNGAIYGKLYNWYAVAGIYNIASLSNPALRKKLAPTGWHVPSDGEWSNLINCLDPNANGGSNLPNIAGGKMKATGTIQAGTGLWQDPNTDATNALGFTVLPGGCRFIDDVGTFNTMGYNGYWWSSSVDGPSSAFYRYLNFDNGSAYRDSDDKRFGYSVRCLRD